MVAGKRGVTTMQTMFEGKLVRLEAMDPQRDAKQFSEWAMDSEYARLLDSDPAMLWSAKANTAWIEKYLPEMHGFSIFTVEENKLVGMISLDGIDWCSGNAWVGIGLGPRENWSKGYGTEAMRLLVRYGFCELNLHRISLTVFEYNPRGIRSYEKAGFRIEGREREFLRRGGKRWDLLYMGLLRSDWEALDQSQ
jgi:RimJ/RimL family protein N-acetyltransferase